MKQIHSKKRCKDCNHIYWRKHKCQNVGINTVLNEINNHKVEESLEEVSSSNVKVSSIYSAPSRPSKPLCEQCEDEYGGGYSESDREDAISINDLRQSMIEDIKELQIDDYPKEEMFGVSKEEYDTAKKMTIYYIQRKFNIIEEELK